jgi:hypothetical protein
MSTEVTALERLVLFFNWDSIFDSDVKRSYAVYEDDMAQCVMIDRDLEVFNSKKIRGVLASLLNKGLVTKDDVNGEYSAWFLTEEGYNLSKELFEKGN